MTLVQLIFATAHKRFFRQPEQTVLKGTSLKIVSFPTCHPPTTTLSSYPGHVYTQFAFLALVVFEFKLDEETVVTAAV